MPEQEISVSIVDVPVLPATPSVKSVLSPMIVAEWSVTEPVPEAKVPAPFVRKTLFVVLTTSLLSETEPMPVYTVFAPDQAIAMLIVEVPVLPKLSVQYVLSATAVRRRHSRRHSRCGCRWCRYRCR